MRPTDARFGLSGYLWLRHVQNTGDQNIASQDVYVSNANVENKSIVSISQESRKLTDARKHTRFQEIDKYRQTASG